MVNYGRGRINVFVENTVGKRLKMMFTLKILVVLKIMSLVLFIILDHPIVIHPGFLAF